MQRKPLQKKPSPKQQAGPQSPEGKLMAIALACRAFLNYLGMDDGAINAATATELKEFDMTEDKYPVLAVFGNKDRSGEFSDKFLELLVAAALPKSGIYYTM